MRMTDRFELPVTAASAEAVADYVAAVDLLLSATPGADARLERALAADPDFALAQIAHARLLQLQARIGEARAAAERATALAVLASTRERAACRGDRPRDRGRRAGSAGAGPRACGGIPTRRVAIVIGARCFRAVGI